MKFSHTESNLANVEAEESDLLSLLNRFESFDLDTAIQQRRNEQKPHSVEISYLTDRYEVVERHSTKASLL